jgi:hypothetical protein
MRKIRPYGCDENFPGSDYQEDEIEFFRAVEEYKQRTHRRYVSLREYLEILKSLGYCKIDSNSIPPN